MPVSLITDSGYCRTVRKIKAIAGITQSISEGVIKVASFFSGFFTITHSVVINNPATDAAYSKASLVTLTGSITPDSKRCS